MHLFLIILKYYFLTFKKKFFMYNLLRIKLYFKVSAILTVIHWLVIH